MLSPAQPKGCEEFVVVLGNVLNREGGVAKNKRRAVSQLHAFSLGRDGRIPFQEAGATEGDELGAIHSIEVLNDGAILNEALLQLFCFDGDLHAFRIGFAVLVPPQLLVGLAVVIADGGDLLRGGELEGLEGGSADYGALEVREGPDIHISQQEKPGIDILGAGLETHGGANGGEQMDARFLIVGSAAFVSPSGAARLRSRLPAQPGKGLREILRQRRNANLVRFRQGKAGVCRGMAIPAGILRHWDLGKINGLKHGEMCGRGNRSGGGWGSGGSGRNGGWVSGRRSALGRRLGSSRLTAGESQQCDEDSGNGVSIPGNGRIGI